MLSAQVREFINIKILHQILISHIVAAADSLRVHRLLNRVWLVLMGKILNGMCVKRMNIIFQLAE